MTLTIELRDDQEAVLKAKAQEQGLSAEQYAQQILAREPASAAPLSRKIRCEESA